LFTLLQLLQRLSWLQTAFEQIVPTTSPYRSAALAGIIHNELVTLRSHPQLQCMIQEHNGEYVVQPGSSAAKNDEQRIRSVF
jgi:hypothetical protein